LLSLYTGGSKGASRSGTGAGGGQATRAAAGAAGEVAGAATGARGQDARAPFLAGAQAAGGAEKPGKGRVREWKDVGAEYRRRLFVRGGVSGSSGKVALSREQIKRVLKKGGELSVGEVLRLRIRHMTDGVVLGSKGFVDEVWLAHRERFGGKRRSGARSIQGGGARLSGLTALRDLRVGAIS